jgi:deoxycytidylate deaminase
MYIKRIALYGLLNKITNNRTKVVWLLGGLLNGNEQATVHAEQNTIADCAKRGVSCNGCMAYITHYSCVICMCLMCASGVRKNKVYR